MWRSRLHIIKIMAKKTRTELSTSAINTNLPDNTQELITPTTERAQLTDERESVINYKDDLGGTGNAGKFLTVAVDGESLTMVDAPTGDVTGTGVAGQVTFWDGTNNITSNAMLVIDDTNKILKIIIPNANGSGGISIDQQGTTGTGSLQFLDDGVYKAQIVYDVSDGNLTLNSNGDIKITPTGDTVISGGNVGIGTDSPSSKLDITATRTAQLTLIELSTNTLSSGVDDEISIDFGRGLLDKYSARISGYISNYSTYDGGLKFYTSSGGTLNTTPQLTISSGGLATFSNGIKFGGTPSPAYHSGADTLDAYEEGTWTPNLYIGTTATSATIVISQAIYTRVGRLVNAYVYLSSITNVANNGNQLYIGGLPYNSYSGAYYSTGQIGYSNTANIESWRPLVETANSRIYFHEVNGNTSPITGTQAQVLNSKQIIITITYFT